MARPLRLNLSGGLYHVMTRGVDRGVIFRDDQDRQRFLQLLAEAVERFGWLLHAFSLMLTHFHLMPETPRGNLSEGMAWLKSVYAAAFNYRHGRVGHLYDNRFKAKVIQDVRYAHNVHHYIHQNPVEAGIVELPWQDPWNSSRYFLGLEPPPRWLNTGWMLSHFEDLEAYKHALLRAAENPDVCAIGGAVLGERRYAASLLTDEVLANPDISRRLDLGRLWEPEEILAALAAEGTDIRDLRDLRPEASDHRSLAMFLLRELGGIPIAEVSAQAGITKGAVSRRVSSVRKRAEADPSLADLVRRVAARLAKLTPPG